MDYIEAAKIGIQLGMLRELMPQYSHRTLDNIIQGLEARLREDGITNEMINSPEKLLKFMQEHGRC